MTLPRLVMKGDVVMGTRRTSERRFFLRPSPATDRIFLYCLARAVRITGVQLHEFQVLSDHYHIVFTDVNGKRPKFFQLLNQFVAKNVNQTLGRWESLFAPGSYNAVTLVDGDAIEAECIYTLCNAVKHGLVTLPEYWDGVSSWRMEYGRSITIERPEGFFTDSNEKVLDEEVLVLTRPEALYPGLTDTEARAQLRDRARERSHKLVEDLRNEGRTFVGMKRVRKASPNSSAKSREPRRGLRPTVAGKNKEARIEALERYAEFLVKHKAARLEFEKGNHDVVFPRGTYLMVVRYGVAVEQN